MYLGCFMLPVSIIFACYIGIVQSIKEHSKMMAATASKMGAKTSKEDKDKKAEVAVSLLINS